MRPQELRRIRRDELALTQEQLVAKLGTTRMTITRYEAGTRRIPGLFEFALAQLRDAGRLPMLGTVAAGKPIEAVVQSEFVDVPPGLMEGGERFALRVVGQSMRDEGILPGDIVVVRKQSTARTGETVVALINGEATIKKYYAGAKHIELRPANPAIKPIRVTASDEFRIQGVVVGLLRHYR